MSELTSSPARLWAAARDARGPIVAAVGDDVALTFVARTDGAAAGLWMPASGRPLTQPMRRIGALPDDDDDGGVIWALTLTVPAGTIGCYAFVVPDLPVLPLRRLARGIQARLLGRRAMADPLNPHRAPSVHAALAGTEGECSVFGADAVPADALLEDGLSDDHRAYRMLRTGRDAERTVLVLDGEITAWLAGDLHRATAERRIAPATYVFVHNRSARARRREHLADEALPAELAALAGVRGVAGRRAVIVGVSTGGVAALRTALGRPDRFDGVIALSAPFRTVRPPAARSFDIVLGHGRQEEVGASPIPAATARAADALHGRTRSLAVRSFPGGHDIAAWRAPILDALTDLIPAQTRSTPS